jgi:hypothetical protein
MEHPTQAELREWFIYNPMTGRFYWQKEPKKIGRLMGREAGCLMRKTGYIHVGVPGYSQFGAHRLAWIYAHGVIPRGLEIDHIDGDRSNNALGNLRLATSREQKRNKCVQSNNRSGLKGAYYHACHKGKKWRSQINLGNKLVFLGYFHTAEEAHKAYGIAAVEYFGQFARVA